MYQPSVGVRVYQKQFCVCELRLVYNAKHLAHTLIKTPENYRLMLMIAPMLDNFFTEDIHIYMHLVAKITQFRHSYTYAEIQYK
jgi:hypothetical protein